MTQAASDRLNAQLRAEMEAAKPTKVRLLMHIALDIQKHWRNPNFSAVPYLNAMACLLTISDSYGEDSARSIVTYFLSNAKAWRGEDARRIKAELNAMLG